MIITLVNPKGGVGKTTTAVNLACWLRDEHAKTVLVIDADKQQSSTKWLGSMEQGFEIHHPADAGDLADSSVLFADKYDFVVVDCPAADTEYAQSAIMISDYVLVPIRAGEIDLSATHPIVGMLARVRRMRQGDPRAMIFINAAQPRTKLFAEVNSQLKGIDGMPLAKSYIVQRTVVADAPSWNSSIWSMSGGAAKLSSQEYTDLFEELELV